METTEARRETKDILFRRIGVDLPLSEGSEAFDGPNVPVRGLAVSNQFGISFFVHPAGFVVTQTSILVNVAQQAKDGASGKTAQQGCYLNVPVPGVRILCLSRDELTLAACVGDQIVHLYDVPTLVHKLDGTPLETRDISEGRVKDFRWSPADDEIYLLLSREGQLFSGHVGENPSRVVDGDVVAVSWSPDGKYVAYVSKERAVCIINSKFELQYTFELPAELGDVTDNLQVESLQWVRPDAMLVAYTQTNEDGDDEECPFILVTSGDGDLAKEGGTVTAVVFDNTFPSIDSRVLPSGSGPYMLAEYIKPWEMAISASRRSVDDHIVILGWFSEERKNEAFSIELTNDTWLPRIELQENGDDNILLGLAVCMTTTDLQVTDPRDDSGDTKLPACPVLMCLSLGGKLSLFSVARLDESVPAAELVSLPSKLPESNRAEVKSEGSAYMVTKAVDKENHSSQYARNKQAEEKVDDEPSISSGSDSDREDDGSNNDEVLSRFPAPGRFGTVSETQRKNLAVKEGSHMSTKETPSVPSLQMPGASALSSLASTGPSNTSHLSTVKSAPSGLDQIQQTTPSPVPSNLLTRTVTQVQSSNSRASSFSHNTAFPSLSSANLKHPQSSGLGLFGQAGNDKGTSSQFTSIQGTSSASLSSGSLETPQSSGFGAFGQAGNYKGPNSQTSSPFHGTSSASLSSGSLRPQQSSGFGFGNQVGNDNSTSSQFASSFQGTTSGNLRPQQSSGFGFGNQAGNDKGTRAPIATQKSSPLERGSQIGPQKLTTSGARTLSVSSARQSGVSEPEQAFIVELEKIKKMADEVDNLMAYIEGRGQRTTSNQPPCFTKQSLNELELGIRTLADNCKTVKERVEEERQSLNNLRDENLQVDAWRLYVQSLAEQAAENRHQELWGRRKLAPDLDVKRKRVTKAEQALKQQIAALEEHVHHLELDNRKRVVSLKGGKNNLNRQAGAGRSQSIQNLYSTVNGLLSSADRLSQQVAQQMEALNIPTRPQTTQKIMQSVGLSSDDTVHVQSRPTFSGTTASPLARQQSIKASPALKAELGLPIHTTPPRRTMPSDSGVGAPSVTRRRRDSMDGVQKALALAGGASPKTTIERVSHHTPAQQPNPSSSSSNTFVKHIRQRSFQESSEESSSHPRHVRRVLSSQTRSATSSPPSTSFISENKASSIPSGFPANSGVTSLHGSQSPTSLPEQQSIDSRPDSKRAAPRNVSSFAEKAGPTLASRFGPPPGRTTPIPTTAVSASSSAAGGSSFGPSPSNASSENVFKFANNNTPNSPPTFSFATPSVVKPSGTLDNSGPMPFGKPVTNMGTTKSSSAGATGLLSSFPSSVFGSAESNTMTGSMSTTNLGIESTKPSGDSYSKSSADTGKEKPAFGFKAASFGTPTFGSKSRVDFHPTTLVDVGKEEKPAFGSKAASFGTPTFGTPSFSSGSFSRPSFSGLTQPATTESDEAGKQNETKQALALTPPAQPISNQSSLSKTMGAPELSFCTEASQIPASAVVPPPAAKPSAFATQVITAAPTNSQTSLAQGSQQPFSLNVPASTPNLKPSSSLMGSLQFPQTSTPSAVSTSNSQTPFVFPAASSPASTFTVPPITTPDTDEEDMDEEQVIGGSTSLGGFNLGGLGLGGSSIAQTQAPKTSLFGNSAPFGSQQTSSAFGTPQSSTAFGTQPTSSGFGTSSPQGPLFRPPSFSLPSAQSPPQTSGGFGGFGGFGISAPPQTGGNPFGSAFGSTTSNPPSGNLFGTTTAGSSPAFGSPAQPGAGGFGQPSQLGPGQQALGSALGSFGQTRQMGFGSTSPFGSTPSAGFGSAVSGGGFASAGTGGGFASAGTGGGFASSATGGGFASAGTGGGFAGAATGGGFAAAGGAPAGFAGASGGGGFQAFGGGGQPAFGTTSPPAQSLFTQMRK